jgi:hypothetical protein
MEQDYRSDFLSAQGMGHTWMSPSQVGVNAAVESWKFMSHKVTLKSNLSEFFSQFFHR